METTQEKKIYELPPSQQYLRIKMLVDTDDMFVAKFGAGVLAGFTLGLLTRLVF